MVNDEQIKQKVIEDDGEVERSYQMALMVTFSPGVRSWGTNSQWQLLLSSAMSSPGRLASKARRKIKKLGRENFSTQETQSTHERRSTLSQTSKQTNQSVFS